MREAGVSLSASVLGGPGPSVSFASWLERVRMWWAGQAPDAASPPGDRSVPMSAESERLEAEEVSSTERPFIPDTLPVLPLRDTVLFPNSFMPLAVAREASVRLIDDAIAAGKVIGVFAQRDPA